MRSGPLLMYFHGNASTIHGCAPIVHGAVRSLQMPAIAVEYPGYGPDGGSKRQENGAWSGAADDGPARRGKKGAWQTGASAKKQPAPPREEWTHEAALLAVDHAMRRGWIRSPDQLLLWGTSLGAAVAVHLASTLSQHGHPPAGLALVSGFGSVREVARDMVGSVAAWLSVPGDMFASTTRLPTVTCPVAILHGDCDRVVHPRHAWLLYDSARSASVCAIAIIRGGQHDLDHDTVVQPYLADLAQRAFAPASEGGEPESEPTFGKHVSRLAPTEHPAESATPTRAPARLGSATTHFGSSLGVFFIALLLWLLASL
jgi:hypothetical protein